MHIAVNSQVASNRGRGGGWGGTGMEGKRKSGQEGEWGLWKEAKTGPIKSDESLPALLRMENQNRR